MESNHPVARIFIGIAVSKYTLAVGRELARVFCTLFTIPRINFRRTQKFFIPYFASKPPK
jgi:hypothetical protein